MDLLVLDTIHGGNALAAALSAAGHQVDRVDVYRGAEGISRQEARRRKYDLIIAPVHLPPSESLLHEYMVPVITHHDAARWVIGRDLPSPMIEITGAQGKTTTAFALASVMEGNGVLHTSSGTFAYPDHAPVWKKSITPASVIAAVEEARSCNGWLIAEESLGVTGAGDLCIITSGKDYACAGGSKSAIYEKVRSGLRCRRLLVASGVPSKTAVHVDDIATVTGILCTIEVNGISSSFSNPLLTLNAYRTPLALAAAAACLLGLDPAPLGTFTPVTGRLSVRKVGGVVVVDDANSGVNADTAVEAATYVRSITDSKDLALVIGRVAKTVCEGFPAHDIARAIQGTRPDIVVYVADEEGIPTEVRKTAEKIGAILMSARSLEEGKAKALETGVSAVALAVKVWR